MQLNAAMEPFASRLVENTKADSSAVQRGFMIAARRTQPAAVLVALALASVSIAGFAGPRTGEGDRSARGHERTQRQQRSTFQAQSPAAVAHVSQPGQSGQTSEHGRANSRGSRPAQVPRQFVATAPARFDGLRTGNPWNHAQTSRAPVFAPPSSARTRGQAHEREGWRTTQPIRAFQTVDQPAWNNGGTERRNWDRRDLNQREWGRHNWERRSYYGYGRYPARGYLVDRLPDHYLPVVYRRERFFFDDGIWYRPFGARFVVAAPPIGVVIPILPALYATFWIGSVPYYYANEAYYRWSDPDQGYLVVDRPANLEEEPTESAPDDELYIYPSNNQTEDEQSADRYTCHRWSVDQTGYDPSQPGTYSRNGELDERRANYRRAMQACLSARGYSVT